MDLRMPGMDGKEAARKIREAENGGGAEDVKKAHTPIIALTAGLLGDEEPAFLSPLFDDRLPKPFRQTEVFSQLEKHLRAEFVYRSSGEAGVETDSGRQRENLTPADLSVLPAEWLKDFFQTLKKGRSAELIERIDRISREHAALASALAESVRIHQYDRLIPLIRQALEENPNG
jgi:CheY-like chemotaxis protein